MKRDRIVRGALAGATLVAALFEDGKLIAASEAGF